MTVEVIVQEEPRYRVLMRDQRGMLWGPVIVARSRDEAEQKALEIFPRYLLPEVVAPVIVERRRSAA
jgi:hypothetical protein